jgi:hypothetical protein
MCNGYIPNEFNNICERLMVSLILDLSNLLPLVKYSYLSRHTKDTIPSQKLEPFLQRHQNLVQILGEQAPYNIPTVWFVGFFDSDSQIEDIEKKIETMPMQYYDETHEFQSFEELNQPYWEQKEDAQLFIIFLDQLTKIGINLLRNHSCLPRLKELNCLEWLLYQSNEKMEADLAEIKRLLSKNSEYYRENIENDQSQIDVFWSNFRKLKKQPNEDGTTRLGSWPHFLFNICGLQSEPKIC